MENTLLPAPALEQIRTQRKVRKEVAAQSHYWFFHLYFSQYVTHETAPFQREMFEITENRDLKTAVIVAFRGSAKSTIFTLSYPIWAVTGKQGKKFVLILSQTQQQARQHLVNLKRELETNELLRADLGPFEYQSDEWGVTALVLPKFGAKIMAASSETSIRGIKHGQYRPDLIICDDVEDLQSVKTREGRNKTYDWLTGEVIPCGDQNTKRVIVGNLLHEDSLLMRLRKRIEENLMDGVFKGYPLLDNDGISLWPGKYGTQDLIDEMRRNTGSESAWQREYLLRIIADEDRVIRPEWIQYYDELPAPGSGVTLNYSATGIDLAISEKASADYTAMVSGHTFGYGTEQVIYIVPNPVNERMDFPETLKRAKAVSVTLGRGEKTKLYIEEVGYQKAFIQQLELEDFDAEGVQVGTSDKRSRLALTTSLIQSGGVKFPRTGCERLIEQLTGFGVEKHDDLADAFAILVLKAIEENKGSSFGIFFVPFDRDDDDEDWADRDDRLSFGIDHRPLTFGRRRSGRTWNRMIG